MNKVAAFALRRKNSILSMSEKLFCPPQPLRFWITPACAGKRGSGSPPRSCRRDHPRVCGEKHKLNSLDRPAEGSPPRMRGKAAVLAQRLPGLGITPAYAGKSCSSRRCCGCCWDHPRVCGEKNFLLLMTSRRSGSPPHVRGKVDRTAGKARRAGITPAYAGKSFLERIKASISRDHPRACGEK